MAVRKIIAAGIQDKHRAFFDILDFGVKEHASEFSDGFIFGTGAVEGHDHRKLCFGVVPVIPVFRRQVQEVLESRNKFFVVPYTVLVTGLGPVVVGIIVQDERSPAGKPCRQQQERCQQQDYHDCRQKKLSCVLHVCYTS